MARMTRNEQIDRVIKESENLVIEGRSAEAILQLRVALKKFKTKPKKRIHREPVVPE